MRPDYEALNSHSSTEGADPRRVLLVFALYLYAFMWLVQSVLTKNTWLNNLFRPYLPNWALLILAFSAPVTLALIGLRSVPWKISILFAFIGFIQAGMFGLVGEKYRLVQGVITVFAFIEAYVILPKWNRRILEGKRDGTILHLK
jgi:hypothetical protein